MRPTTAIARRVRRRELHSSRSIAAIVVAVAVILTLAWLGVEVVLRLLDLPPLLADPAQMLEAGASVTSLPAGWKAAAGVLLAATGLVLIALALSPGRRARHAMPSQHGVTLVDDGVVASRLARVAAAAGGVDRGSAVVTVSRRRALIRITPASGILVDRTAVLDAVSAELVSLALEPALHAPRLRLEQGRVGG